jgi:hypothetical protein
MRLNPTASDRDRGFQGDVAPNSSINVDGALRTPAWYDWIHGLPFLPETREAVVNAGRRESTARHIRRREIHTTDEELNKVFWITLARSRACDRRRRYRQHSCATSLAADQQRQAAELRLVEAEKEICGGREFTRNRRGQRSNSAGRRRQSKPPAAKAEGERGQLPIRPGKQR